MHIYIFKLYPHVGTTTIIYTLKKQSSADTIKLKPLQTTGNLLYPSKF